LNKDYFKHLQSTNKECIRARSNFKLSPPKISLRMGEKISTATQYFFGRDHRKFRCAWAKIFKLQRNIFPVESTENFAAHGRNDKKINKNLELKSQTKLCK